MKSKIFGIIMVLCVLFTGVIHVHAQNSMDNVIERYIELINDKDYTITNEDNKLKISLTNPTYGPYFIEFNINDNKISYTNSRDVSSANDETKIYYNETDMYFITALFYGVIDAFDVDMNKLNESLSDEDYSKLGFVLVTGDEITYTSEDENVSMATLNQAVIDLSKFDEYTKDMQGAGVDKDATKQLINLFKMMANPMSKSVLGINEDRQQFIDEMGNIIGTDVGELIEPTDENNSESNVEETDADKKAQVVSVPPTLATASAILSLVGATTVVGSGLTIYNFTRSKKNI